jgi:hypothetical protein
VNDNGPILNLCGLWAGKEGSKLVASGRLGEMKLLLFHNDTKGNPKAPAYRLCMAKWEDREQDRPASGATQRGPNVRQTRQALADDDDPFGT